MRHRKHTSKLNRTSEHRLAMMRNLSAALIEHERIQTTASKARQLRPFVEKLVTLARRGTLADRRLVLARLPQREAVSKLFDTLAPRIGERPGGYLRIVKDARRMGDGAPMAWIEFVDSEGPGGETAPVKRKTLKQRMHERRKEMARMRKDARA